MSCISVALRQEEPPSSKVSHQTKTKSSRDAEASKTGNKSSNVTPPSSSVAQQTTLPAAQQLPLPRKENLYIFDMEQAWQHFREFLPNEVFHLDVPSEKEGIYGNGASFYVPSEAMMKKPDLQELFNFMAEDKTYHVLQSRPLIDFEQRLVFRQFGRMNALISKPDKNSWANQIDILWFPGEFAGELVAPCSMQ